MAKITQEMIEQIRLEAAKLGRTPMRDESEIKGPIQGGWHNAVEEAGLCPYDGFRKEKIRPPKNGESYSDEELINFVHEAAGILKRVPNRGAVPEYPFIEYRFGCWSEALEKMGYQVKHEWEIGRHKRKKKKKNQCNGNWQARAK